MAKKQKKWTQQELHILYNLRKNARTSLVTIGRKTGMPTSSVFDKVHFLSKSLLTKHVSLLNFSKLGYGLMVHYLFSTSQKDIYEFLEDHPHINTLSKLDGHPQFFVEAIFKNMKQAQEFSEQLQKYDLSNYREHYIAEEIKREDFLSHKKHLELF